MKFTAYFRTKKADSHGMNSVELVKLVKGLGRFETLIDICNEWVLGEVGKHNYKAPLIISNGVSLDDEKYFIVQNKKEKYALLCENCKGWVSNSHNIIFKVCYSTCTLTEIPKKDDGCLLDKLNSEIKSFDVGNLNTFKI